MTQLLPILALVAGAPGEAAGGPGGYSFTVCAATSLTRAVTDAARRFEARHGSGLRIRTSFAPSSTLAQQIERGAEAAVFISADAAWVEHLRSRGLVRAESVRAIASNELVFVVPRESRWSGATEKGFDLAASFSGRLALADPSHVPAGIYARQALESLGWWTGVRERVVPAPDPAGAVKLVELGEAAAAVVYRTDVLGVETVKAALTIPEWSHSPIQYVAALTTAAPKEASELLDFLSSEEGAAILRAHGFRPAGRIVPASRLLLTPDESAALWLSVKVSLVATLLAAVPGIACAWVLARKRFWGHGLLNALVHLPLVAPPTAIGYVLLVLLGRGGVLGEALSGAGIEIAFTWRGAALASAVMGFPLLVRAARIGLELVDRRIEEAASVLGAGPWRVLMTITLPLALPGILTGLLLAFARSLGEFGATITFAGNIAGETQTLPLAVHVANQTPGGGGAALRLVLLSFTIALTALLVSEVLGRRAARRLEGDRC